MEPIEVRFERAVAPEDAKDGETTKQIKRTLFQKMNPYPQKKAITFNRFSDDFKFTVWIGDKLAATADLSGVKEAHEKYSDAEPKGVKVGHLNEILFIKIIYVKTLVLSFNFNFKAHFKMDDSGVLSLESAEATFEKEVMPEEEEKKEDIKAPDIDKGVLDNLKEKFGSFFNGDAKDGDAEKILEELGKAQAEKKAKEAEESENQDTEEVGDDTEEKTEDEKTEEKTDEKTNEKIDEKTDETAEEPKDDEKSEEKPEKAEKEEKSEEESDQTKSEEDAKDDKKDEKKEEEKVKEV